MNDNVTAQLAQFQPREDRVTLWRILQLVFAPRRGRHAR